MTEGTFYQLRERSTKRLLLPAYAISEAALLAEIAPQTVHRWYAGYLTASGKRSAKLLMGEEQGIALSYLQLIEVAVVATFRKMGVSLQRLRIAHSYLLKRFDVEYPFAQLKLKTDGANVLKDLEDAEGKWVNQLIEVPSEHGQIVWASAIRDRIREFDYDKE